jgi:N-acetylmuramoyl-L-alanine amidase
MSKIYIDPGHGGKDPGAIGVNGVHEADINLKVAKYLKVELERHGQEVRMSRETDVAKTLDERVNDANNWGADIFCSTHCNAFSIASAKGTETLIYANGGNAEKIAKKVHSNIVATLKTSDRGIRVRPELVVLRKTKAPAVLCELGFITNEDDCAKLVDASYQKKCAIAICKGILSHLGIIYKEEVKVTNDYTGHWAEPAIKEMGDKGIMVGDGKGNFRPNDSLTRGELAQAISNLLKYLGK